MDAAKKAVSVKVAALALLFFLSLSIAENLGAPISIYPNQTQASATHYNYNTSFNVTLFANATASNLVGCNASITLPATELNFTTLPNKANTTSLGDITNQSVSNATWGLIALGRGPHYLNFSLVCNGSSSIPANTTIYVDLLNITLVNVTTPYSIRWNDSYMEVYRNASYNISVRVSTLDTTQSLTNVIVYLNETNSSAFALNASNQNQQTIFNAATSNAPSNTAYAYTLITNDTQNDRWVQPLVVRVISPLNVTISYNDSAIVANQSFIATATARNLGPLNLTGINLTVQTDGGLVLTNMSCGLFNLIPSATNTSCAWTFNSTLPNAKANITINALSLEGDNNTNNFGNKIYGLGSFTTNASIFFGLYNHTAGTVVQTVNLTATATEDLVNFNCAAAGDLNTSISCQSLNLLKSSSSQYNISLAIPTYTSKGMHYGNLSIYAENANPKNVSYSVNITGIKNCSGQTSASLGTRPGGSSTTIVSINITNTGNTFLNATCASGCNTFTGPSISPGGSAAYNISVSMVGSTSTSVGINCVNDDPDIISETTNFTFTIYYPAADTGNTNQNTNTNNNNNQAPSSPPSNATTYTYTVGMLPATTTLKKGESAEFTIEVKNTGTGALSNLTISGESTLQFSVTPTKITSIPKGQAGYSKITITTSSSNTAGAYKLTAKACRTTTSCVTSSESTITIPEDTPENTIQDQTEDTLDTTVESASENQTLTVTTSNNALKLQLENTTNATAYIEVLDSAGNVVYNRTGQVNGTGYELMIPETLKAGNYTLRIAVKDFAGNIIAEKSLAYTAKAQEKKDTKTASTLMLTPSVINALLVIIMALFIIAGIKTSRIGGTIKSTLDIRQKIMDKAHTAYKQGEYGKAREYRTAAESATSTERELMKKIGDSEKKILSLYREGRHLQARKEQENLSRMKKELELLREQHKV